MPGWSVIGGGRSKAKLRVWTDKKIWPRLITVSGGFGSLYLSELEAAELVQGLTEALEDEPATPTLPSDKGGNDT